MQTQALSFGSLAITRNPEKQSVRFEFKNDRSGVLTVDKEYSDTKAYLSSGYLYNRVGVSEKTPFNETATKQNILSLIQDMSNTMRTGVKITAPSLDQDLELYFNYLKATSSFESTLGEIKKGNVSLELQADPRYLTIDA